MLYDILGEYLPATWDAPIIEIIGTIVDKIIADGSGAYIDALMLMMDMSLEEISGFQSEYLVELFTKCLVLNDIVNLQKFCEGIYG
jgi:hypothetical protein